MFLEKYSNMKFNENAFSGSRDVPCGEPEGQTARHDEAKNRFSQFLSVASMLPICVCFESSACQVRKKCKSLDTLLSNGIMIGYVAIAGKLRSTIR